MNTDQSVETLRKIARAKKALRSLSLRLAVDPLHPESRPTPAQEEVLTAFETYRRFYVLGGNRCLAKGTMVATPQGPRAIETLRPGDTVFDEHGRPIRVLKTFQNGVKTVADLEADGRPVATCTREHVFQVLDGQGTTTKAVSELLPGDRIRTVERLDMQTVWESWCAPTYGANEREVETFDIHVASPTNLYLLANGLVTHNSGKTALLARVVAWFFTKDHPFIDLEKKWPKQPLLILVVSRTSEQYTDLWETKIRPFLTPGTYKEERGGGTLLRVRNKENGTKIIFQSHHNPTEAREKVQYFAAHLVALDEQTDNLPLLEELVRRTTDNDGYFFNAMTPKMPAPAVKKYIEKTHRLAKIFKLKMLDNPKMKGREQDILDDIANLPADMQATILQGDWYQEYGKVYAYDPDSHQAFPEGYSVGWRHAEFIDPAASGKVGFGLAAENPRTGLWTVIKAKYLKGEAASDLLDKIELETMGLNITHHVSDPHETWFIKEAWKRKRRYVGVNKDGRKEELIKGVSEALKSGWLKIAPSGCTELEDELYEAEWSPSAPGKILNSTRYHLLDAVQYFVDTRPKFVPHADAPGIWVALDKGNKLRKIKEAKRRAAPKSNFKFRPAIRFR